MLADWSELELAIGLVHGRRWLCRLERPMVPWEQMTSSVHSRCLLHEELG